MPTTEKDVLLPALQQYLAAASQEFDQIPEERKSELLDFAQFIEAQLRQGRVASLNFICTHNSRRSHMSQIWAQVAAAYYGVSAVKTYSGGTEATAFNPRAVKAMQAAGLSIEIKQQGVNPVYAVGFSADAEPLQVWSKAYDDAANPSADFAAIMTCSHADEHCPHIPGAARRFPIRYSDPKEFDDTPLEQTRYAARARQIAREMLYTFSRIKP